MCKMTNEKKWTLLELLETYNVQIPKIQRDYAQGRNSDKIKKIRQKFLRNIFDALVNDDSEMNLEFIYGSTDDQNTLFPLDGQQRLTALVAAMYGVVVKDKNFADKEIKISFNPLTREFAVWTPAYERDTEWISRISDVFLAKEQNSIISLRRKFIKDANEGRTKKNLGELTEDEETTIEDSINALLNLSDFSLPTLEIQYNADEEAVADIFVRVNSGGQKLTENNFIQTLISVYENDTSDRINEFSEKSRIPADNTSYNTLLAIEPSHLIRMAVGVGFRRARLRYAYMLLRGKNLKTGKFSAEERQANLNKFKDALDKVMNLNNWHGFINIVGEAGYISNKLIASSNAVVFSYVLYLIAKYDYKLDAISLRKCISKWFFMSTITYFYTGSTESEVENQFADLRDVNTAEEFIAYIDRVISTRFTDDYFNLTLPSELNSAAAISPAWNGYIAAQIVLNNPMLFSNTPVSKYFIIGSSGTKNAIDKHHIFPKHYLEQIGYTNDRDRNQLANFTYLDYVTNIDISDKAPADYVNAYRQKLGDDGYKKTCEQNALPENFENMEYPVFLEKRRQLMAQIVKKAYEQLCV